MALRIGMHAIPVGIRGRPDETILILCRILRFERAGAVEVEHRQAVFQGDVDDCIDMVYIGACLVIGREQVLPAVPVAEVAGVEVITPTGIPGYRSVSPP